MDQQVVQVADLEVEHQEVVLEAEHVLQVLGDREVDQEVQADLEVVFLEGLEEEVVEEVEQIDQ